MSEGIDRPRGATNELLRAARQVLAGDTSGIAAAAVESALLDAPERDSEADDELLFVLSLYQPRAEAPYAGPAELRAALLEAFGDEL